MQFPIGIASNVAAVIIGGLLGAVMKKLLPQRVVEMLYMTFGFCAISIGIVSVVKLNSLTVVVLSVIFGGVSGELCRIDDGVQKLIRFTMGKIGKGQSADREQMELLCLAMAIICFSGTGIFGALSEGLDGDRSVLLAKSVLDIFTVLVFAAQTGWFVILFSIPQAVVFTAFFLLASLIGPILSPETIADFKAVGGVMTMIVGYNMLAGQTGLKKVRVLNVIPSLLLSVIFSWAAGFLPIAI